MTSTTRPPLSFWQIWNMSFGFLGIQFGFALQNANTSRIFETLGADTSNLALYWLAAPITGLIVQPIIGFYSDRTWHPKWGRRRPYFAMGALFASLALCLMPNSSALWMAVGVLWIMDASINISMEPFRAFVGDLLPPSQRTAGFAMQSFFIGIGAVVASMLPWLFSNLFGVADDRGATGITLAVRLSFYIGAFMLLVTVLWTVFTTREYPPAPGSDEQLRNREKRKLENESVHRRKFSRIGTLCLALGFTLGVAVYALALEKELYVLVFGLSLFGLIHWIAAGYIRQGRSYLGLVNIVKDFNSMPRTMIQLAYVQFFSWFALFGMWIYTTSAITSDKYDMTVSTEQLSYLTSHLTQVADTTYTRLKTSSQEVASELQKLDRHSQNGATQLNVKVISFFLDRSVVAGVPTALQQRLQSGKENFNKGGDWTGFLFAVYNLVAALVALLIPIVARHTSRRLTHFIALCCGAAGLVSFLFISDPNWLLVSMVGVGIAWASILSIPYAMLSGSLPAEKMGYYMGVFNFFIVIPQIVAGTILGILLKYVFNDLSIYVLVAGGISMVVAAFLCLRVDDKDEVEIKA